MKELDELREWGQRHSCLYHVEDKIAALADDIEQAIADRYMELPLDADGVPIHMGDELTAANGVSGKVLYISESGVCMIGGGFWEADQLRHVKPVTAESLLRDFIRAAWSNDTDKYEDDIAEYAAKLREWKEDA